MRRLMTFAAFAACAGALRAAPPAKEMTPEEKQAREVYLLARMGRAKEAEEVARELLKTSPANRAVRLTLCAIYAADGRVEKLLTEAHAYLKHYPKDTQGLYYLASAEYRSGHYTEAIRILREIRHLAPKGAKDPYLVDYSAASWLGGEWPSSLEAHIELLRESQLAPELRLEIRRQLDELYRKHLDVAKAGVEYLDLQTGDAIRASASEEIQVDKRLRLEASYKGDQIELRRTEGIAHFQNYRQEAALKATYEHDTLWSSSYQCGASETAPLGKIRVDYALPYRRSWYLEGSAYGRATDSLLLEGLDGRESRLETGGSLHLAETLIASAEGHVRRVYVGDQPYGDAAGGDWRFAKTVFQNGPSLVVSYRGVYEEFGRSSRTIDYSRLQDPAFSPVDFDRLLVPHRFHRQGVDAEWAGRFGSAWPYKFFGSVDYDFETDGPVYGVGCELAFRPRKSFEIRGRAEYQSAGSGGNATSQAYILSLSATYYH